MASAFSHIAVPAVLYAFGKSRSINFKLFLVAAVCSVIPDADVLAFKFNIPYQSQWGHRGFTHSIAFALCLAYFLSVLHRQFSSTACPVFWFCFTSCISHALLDAMTNGGFGVALFWPFSSTRFFFSFRPIEVSPIGISNFFTGRGVDVIASEFVWVLMPAFVIGLAGAALRRKYRAR